MNILLVGYQLGIQSSGISANNFLRELQTRGGVCVKVLTTNTCVINEEHRNNYILCNLPARYIPIRFSDFIGNLIQRDISHIGWELQARRKCVQLFRHWIPDVILGYCSPVASAKIAEYLGKKYHIPYIAHFTDPIPAPSIWKPDKKYRKRMLRTLDSTFKDARFLSFANKEKLLYQQSLLLYDIIGKSFITPDSTVVRRLSRFSHINDEKRIFVYLGSIYGQRKPNNLFTAFDSFVAIYPNTELHIYDSVSSKYNDIAYSPNIGIRIIFKGRVADTASVMRGADLLIDLNAENDNVFTSYKMVEYLCSNVPILAIASPDSPTTEILKGLKTAKVVGHSNAEILNGMVDCYKMSFSEEEYIEERQNILSRFDVTNIVSNFLYVISKK